MAVLTRPLVHAPFAAALVLVFVAACHGDAHNEPTPASPAASATTPTRPVGHQTHRIVFQDHRHVVPLRVDDLVLLPDDPAFEWKIEFEDKSAATQATDVDAGGEAYRVTKAGPVRVMVYGDPKACMHSDAACTLSKRRWDITLAVD
jgi:hypothetical protein